MTDPSPRGAGPATDEQGRSTVKQQRPSDGSDAAGPGGYDGPGAWGTAALWLLSGLFVAGGVLTIRSILVTFGG